MGTHTGPMTSGKDSDIKKYYSALEKIFYDNMPGTDALPLLPWERSLVDPPTYIDHTPTPKKKCNCLVDPPPSTDHTLTAEEKVQLRTFIERQAKEVNTDDGMADSS